MEKRLDELNHLKSKYGSTIADILSELEKKQGRLQQLQDFDQYIGNLKQKLADAEQDLKKYCDKVSKIRKNMQKTDRCCDRGIERLKLFRCEIRDGVWTDRRLYGKRNR